MTQYNCEYFTIQLASKRSLHQVEEGEELTDMYTVHWTEYTLEERR